MALRITGAGLVLIALLGLAFAGGSVLGGLMLLVLGAVLWLLGHWHFAFRYHTYKSPLAQRIFEQLLPPRFDPTRGWGVPTVDRDR